MTTEATALEFALTFDEAWHKAKAFSKAMNKLYVMAQKTVTDVEEASQENAFRWDFYRKCGAPLGETEAGCEKWWRDLAYCLGTFEGCGAQLLRLMPIIQREMQAQAPEAVPNAAQWRNPLKGKRGFDA
jgi:hypothetical protein